MIELLFINKMYNYGHICKHSNFISTGPSEFGLDGTKSARVWHVSVSD